MRTPIYLDYAAATPVDADVLKAMQPYFADIFYNPSATYLSAKAVHQDLENARAKVAKSLGVRSSEIIFTAGGTEANNLAINGVLGQFAGKNIVISAIEHDAVLRPASQYKSRLVKVLPSGILDLHDLSRKIDDQTVLVSVMYANNEIGTIQPLHQISEIIEQIKADRVAKGNDLPLYFHTDACQAANTLDLHINRLRVDMMTLNGGKIYGPKQSGVLYVKSGVRLKPQILGGGQENGRRSGTENVAFAVGLATALEKVQSQRTAEQKRLMELQKYFIDQLISQIPGVRINGSLKNRLANNVHVTLPGQDNEQLMMKLDEQGIQCAVGSACSASNEEPSHVLKAIGLSDTAAQSSLRFSMGRKITKQQLLTVVRALKKSLV